MLKRFMRNKAIQMTLVEKTPDNENFLEDEETVRPYQDPEQMKEIAKDFVKYTAIVIVSAFAVGVALTAAKEIIVAAAKANQK